MKPKLDDEEAGLFRDAVRDVKPLRLNRPELTPAGEPRRKGAAKARFARARHFAVLEESVHAEAADPVVASEDALSYRRPGVPESVLRKLRRGEPRVEGEIDLHGLTVAQARYALHAFLAEALARHTRCVRIIHGKGLRSGDRGAVLKTFVSGVLRRTAAVIAYVSARPTDGGTGAVYVLLSAWHP